MERHYQRNAKVSKRNAKKTSPQFPLGIEERVKLLQEGLHEFAVQAALEIATTLLNDEVAQICGERYKRHSGSRHYRYGAQKGVVTIAGQKHPLKKPRVRGKSGGEVALERYALLNDKEAMPESVLRRLVRGVSCRDYKDVIDLGMKGFGVKRSSVSRSFVKGSVKLLKLLCERRFDGVRFAVILIDGIVFAGETMVVAMGITERGEKIILGLRQGATESGDVVKDLLEEIVSRGVDTTKATLFVLDGAKALHSAVKKLWGKNAIIQRCQEHKKRNVKGYLPKNMHDDILGRMNDAYNEDNYEKALKKLKNTANWLNQINPSAADSLREGLEETLTAVKLGMGVKLRRTLSNTNPIESAFSVVRETTRRVNRWRGGDMRLRWCAAGLTRAEEKFNRVKGYREIPALITKLERLVSEKSFDTKPEVA